MNILGLGLPELIVIALILLLFFGSKRLPGLFRSIGSSISELKSGLNESNVTETKEAEGVVKREEAEEVTKKPAEDGTKSS